MGFRAFLGLLGFRSVGVQAFGVWGFRVGDSRS